jgi:hypothetical protein
MTVGAARSVFDEFGPQIIMESILSREWGNRNSDTRWQVYRAALDDGIRKAIAGVDWTKHLLTELKYLAGELLKRDKDDDQIANTLPLADDLSKVKKLIHGYLDCAPSTDPAFQPGAPVNQLCAMVDALIDIGKAQNTVWTSMADVSDLVIVVKRLVVDQKLHYDGERALKALDDLKGTFEAITNNNEYSIVGDPSPLNGPITHSPEVNIQLLRQEKESLKPVWDKVAEMKPPQPAENKGPSSNEQDPLLDSLADLVLLNEFRLRRGVALVQERYEMQRNATLNEFARLAQKPDFFVLRALAGNQADAIFPLEESSDDRKWYFGPALT